MVTRLRKNGAAAICGKEDTKMFKSFALFAIVSIFGLGCAAGPMQAPFDSESPGGVSASGEYVPSASADGEYVPAEPNDLDELPDAAEPDHAGCDGVHGALTIRFTGEWDGDLGCRALINLGTPSHRLGEWGFQAGADEAVTISSVVVTFSYFNHLSPFVPGTFDDLTNLRFVEEDGHEVARGEYVGVGRRFEDEQIEQRMLFRIARRIDASAELRLSLITDVRPTASGGVSGVSVRPSIVSEPLHAGDPLDVIASGECAGLLSPAEMQFHGQYGGHYVQGPNWHLYQTVVSGVEEMPDRMFIPANSGEQVVARIRFSNTTNVGNYDAIVRFMHFAYSSSFSVEGRQLRAYRDEVGPRNLIATGFSQAWPLAYFLFDDRSFEDIIIAAGSGRVMILTLDMGGTRPGDNFQLWPSYAPGETVGTVHWSDSALEFRGICAPPSGPHLFLM